MKIFSDYTPEVRVRLLCLSPKTRELFSAKATEMDDHLERLLSAAEKLDAQLEALRRETIDIKTDMDVIPNYKIAVDICLEHFGISREQIESKTRTRPIMDCRSMISATLHPRFSQKEIGRLMGGRDRTTILNQLNNHQDWILTNDSYRQKYELFKREYNGLTEGVNANPPKH